MRYGSQKKEKLSNVIQINYYVKNLPKPLFLCVFLVGVICMLGGVEGRD